MYEREENATFVGRKIDGDEKHSWWGEGGQQAEREEGYNWYFLCVIFDIPVTRRAAANVWRNEKRAEGRPRRKRTARTRKHVRIIYIYNVIITVIIILRQL